MTSAIDKNCTFLISNDKSGNSVTQEEILKDLETNDVAAKIRLVITVAQKFKTELIEHRFL